MRSRNLPWGVAETTLLRHKPPDYYRGRAEEARTLAEAMNSPGSKAVMLDIAEEWDRIANRIERPELGKTG